LEIQGLRELFSFIYSGTALFGKHKVLRKFLRKNNLAPEDVIYVGDETRDIEASMKIRIKVVAVSWGFNSAQALAAQNPDFLIHHPRELVEVLGSLQRVVS
jgi:phosphoglycolate phosphatase-like HAD superfamily hydrolase